MKTKPPKTEKKMGNLSLAMLIEYYTSDMQRRGLRPDSVKGSLCALGLFARWLPGAEGTRLVEVTPEHAAGYLIDLQTRKVRYRGHAHKPEVPGPLSPFTIQRQVKELKVFGNWLAREGMANPFSDLKLPKVPRRTVDTLSDEEIQAITSSLNTATATGARATAMVLLMLDSGLRIGEVAGALLPNTDLRRRQLKVMGKGQKERLVPFGTLCAQALLRYINLYRPTPRRPETEHLFLAMDGEPLTRDGMECIVRRIRGRSGVARLHAHLFRHTFAVRYLLNGGNLITLQMILGHESLEVTKIYLSFTQQQAAALYEGLSPVDRMPIEGARRFGYKRRPASP